MPKGQTTSGDSVCKCWSIRKPNPASPAESPSAKPTSLDSVCKCWSVRKPNPGSPAESPRAKPTSLDSVCKCCSVTKPNQPLPANPQGVHEAPAIVSAGPGPSGSATQNNPLGVIAPAILRLCSSGVRMHKMGAPLMNYPPQIQPAAPSTIVGMPAPANYEAQIIRHPLDQHNLRQNAPDLCDVRQIS